MKRETDALDADVTTEKGRKAIASMAYKVARTKTAIDEAGKKLNEEARARINAVDEIPPRRSASSSTI
jgi:colicin import membrane protein